MKSFIYILSILGVINISSGKSLCPYASGQDVTDKTINNTTNSKKCEPEYCWKDYFGKIPSDAISGGTDESGNPLYVGQAYFRGKELLPVTIYSENKLAVGSANGQVLKTKTNVKILCGPNKAKFVWKPTESKNLHMLTNGFIIPGGSEVGEMLYIGRVAYNSRVTLGKIFQHYRDNKGIWIPTEDGHTKNLLSYEVLIYSCKEENVNPLPCATKG